MRHEAVFVQAGEDRVAPVVTVPDKEPRGMAIVLAGTGRHNVLGTMAGMLSTRRARLDIAAARTRLPGRRRQPGDGPLVEPLDCRPCARRVAGDRPDGL